MPIVAIGAAAFAGMEIATVGLAAMSTFEAIAAVGAITSAVGVVTGNKDLTRIGGIAALVGGVGAIGQNSGWWGEAATDASGSVASSTAEMGGNNPSAYTATPAVENIASANTSGLNPALDTVGDTTSLANPMTPTVGNGAPLAMPKPTGLIGGATDATGSLIGTGTAAEGAVAQTAANAAKPFSFMDKIKGISTWAEAHPTLAFGAMQTGGAAIGAMFDETKKFQLEQAKKNAANINNVPSLAGYGINSNAVAQLTPTGLINSRG